MRRSCAVCYGFGSRRIRAGNICVAPPSLLPRVHAVRGVSFQFHGMKSEKLKKAKAPVKPARTSAKGEASPKVPAKESRLRAAVRKIKAAIGGRKKKAEKPPVIPPPAEAKRSRPAAPPPPPMKLKSTVRPAKRPDAPPKTSPPPLPRAGAAPKKISVPSILLEGDEPTAPRPSGPGERYALGSAEPALPSSESAELPESYGTQRLLLVARDPHWLYAHWDFTAEQLRKHNTASRDKHLIVRVYSGAVAGEPVVEQHVHPESRNWFLHVGQGGAKFVAQLGYFSCAGKWETVATSAATFTPPDVLSDDTSVRFETIPVEVPFQKLLELVKGAVAEHVPLVEVIQQLRESGHRDLPALTAGGGGGAGAGQATSSSWTPAQERALAEIISIDEVRRVWMGSLEITELLRRSLEKEMSSQAAAMLARGERAGGGAELGGVSSVSSPFGGKGRRKGFWFNVNAELIIYGATEPDADVTIGGRKIQLRRDGTFSFRFALPDGNYDLPVQATSADASDSRRAELNFSRATQYRGEVGQHPQDAKLKAPRVGNVG